MYTMAQTNSSKKIDNTPSHKRVPIFGFGGRTFYFYFKDEIFKFYLKFIEVQNNIMT